MEDNIDDEGIAVVILSALSVELRAVRPHLTSTRTVRHRSGTHFVVGTVGDGRRRVAATVTGEGNHSAAVIAERAFTLFRPKALVLVGIAGSLRPDVRLGDVVVATRVYAYHGGREEPGGLMCSPRCWEAPHELCQLARFVDLAANWHSGLGHARRRVPRVHFGGVAAGEIVLDSQTSPLADHLRRHYGDAIAVEMESAGVAHASHLNQSAPTLTIRAISDTANGTKARTDAAGWRARAAANAAAFAVALIENI